MSPLEKQPPTISERTIGIAAGALEKMKNNVIPGALATVKSTVESARTMIDKINPWSSKIDSNDKAMRKQALLEVVALMFLPRKDANGKPVPLPAKIEDVPVPEAVKTPPRADDLKGKRDFVDAFRKATSEHESSNKPHLINTDAAAINDQGVATNRLGEGLLKKLRENKPPLGLPGLGALKGKWNEAFKGGVPTDFEAFKTKLTEQKIDLNSLPAVLGHSALGQFQIVPKHHFEKIGLNPFDLKDLHKFMSSPDLQKECCDKIIFSLGEMFEWNYRYMAAGYVGGPGGARKLQRLDREQAKAGKPASGEPTEVAKYADRTVAIIQKNKKTEKKE